MSSIADDTLAQIAAYCAAAGIAPTTFGRRAVNDTGFVERLRDGRATVRVIDRARRWMADNPPPQRAA